MSLAIWTGSASGTTTAAASGLRSPSGPGMAFQTTPGTVLWRWLSASRALPAPTQAAQVRDVPGARGRVPVRVPPLMAPRAVAPRAARSRHATEDDSAAASPRRPLPPPLRLPSAPGMPRDLPEPAGSPCCLLAPGAAPNCPENATRPAVPRLGPSGSQPAARRLTIPRTRTRRRCRSHGGRAPASRAAAERARYGSRGQPSAAQMLPYEGPHQRGVATAVAVGCHILTALRPLRSCRMKAHISVASPPSATTTTFWPSASRTSVLPPRCGQRTARMSGRVLGSIPGAAPTTDIPAKSTGGATSRRDRTEHPVKLAFADAAGRPTVQAARRVRAIRSHRQHGRGGQDTGLKRLADSAP
jgi:hypothetical protein